MTEKWLKCDIMKGMFSNEVAIKVNLADEDTYSEFVPKDEVRGEINASGQVRVKVFRENGNTLAVLPNEYSSIIAVKDEDLVGV